MAITTKELREKRAALIKQGREICDKAEAEKRQQTAEERAAWDKIFGGIGPDGAKIVGEEERMMAEIVKLERLELAEADLRSRPNVIVPGKENATGDDGSKRDGGVTEETRELAFRGWCRRQSGMELSDAHMDACRRTGIKPDVKELPIALYPGEYRRTKMHVRDKWNGIESRSPGSNLPQASTLSSAGGYTIPEGFVNNLEQALLQFGGIREMADVMRTASGNDLPWPTVNDTTVKGAIIGENSAVTGGDMTFSTVIFRAYKYYSKLILCPAELIEDSAFNLPAFIGEACGIRIGRIQADHFTTGTGAGQPYGAVTQATLGKTATSATAISADDIMDLAQSVDPAYRKTGCAFSMNDAILFAVKKLKDGMGRYLMQPSLAMGSPDTLLGYPISINQSMDSTVSSGKKTILFGQHSKYKIRDVAEIRLRRLVERYAEYDQEGFIMFMRSDGNLLDAGTHPLKYMVH